MFCGITSCVYNKSLNGTPWSFCAEILWYRIMHSFVRCYRDMLLSIFSYLFILISSYLFYIINSANKRKWDIKPFLLFMKFHEFRYTFRYAIIMGREFFLDASRQSTYSWSESESFVLHDIAKDHITHRRLDGRVVQGDLWYIAIDLIARGNHIMMMAETRVFPPRRAVDATSTVTAMTRMMTWATVKKKGVSWR